MAASEPAPGFTLSRKRLTNPYNGSSQSYWTHGGPASLRSPQSVTVGTAVTNYVYDNALTTANLLRVDQHDSVTGADISTSLTYLGNGNVESQTDANNFSNPSGSRTLICYDSNNLYPIKRVVGATNLSCPSPSKVAEAQTTAFNFDSASGVLLSQTDADNNVTTTFTYDNIGRTIKAEQTGAGLDRVTSTSYDDVDLAVTNTQDDTSANKLVTTTFYDAIGRVQSTVDGVGVHTQKVYRYGTGGLSYELASNPYRSTNDATMGWTLTTRNAMRGTASVTSYAGSALPAPFGSSTNATGTASVAANVINVTGCTGTATRTTDGAGNITTNCADGLGRMSAVIEPNGTVTSYTYDLLNNLTGVYRARAGAILEIRLLGGRTSDMGTNQALGLRKLHAIKPLPTEY